MKKPALRVVKASAAKSGDERIASTDDLGIAYFGGDRVVINGRECYSPTGRDPFEYMSTTVQSSPNIDGALKSAIYEVRDELWMARSIAASIFGKNWETHVLEVYDRLRARAVELAREDENE